MRFKICAVLLIAGLSGAAQAVPIDYEINFTADTGGTPTGTFNYDSDLGLLTDLTVTWEGNNYVDFSFQDIDGVCGVGDEGVFALLSADCTNTLDYVWVADTGFGTGIFTFLAPTDLSLTPPTLRSIQGVAGNNILFAIGSWTITEIIPPIPEPATLALLGVGLAGIGYSRRRRNSAQV